MHSQMFVTLNNIEKYSRQASRTVDDMVDDFMQPKGTSELIQCLVTAIHVKEPLYKVCHRHPNKGLSSKQTIRSTLQCITDENMPESAATVAHAEHVLGLILGKESNAKMQELMILIYRTICLMRNIHIDGLFYSTNFGAYIVLASRGSSTLHLSMVPYGSDMNRMLCETITEISRAALEEQHEDNNDERENEIEYSIVSPSLVARATSHGFKDCKGLASYKPEQVVEVEQEEFVGETLPEEAEALDSCGREDICEGGFLYTPISEPLIPLDGFHSHVQCENVIKKVLLQLVCLLVLLKPWLSLETLEQFVRCATYCLLRNEVLSQILQRNHKEGLEGLQSLLTPLPTCAKKDFDCCEEVQIETDADKKESDKMDYDEPLSRLHSPFHQSEISVFAVPDFQSDADQVVPLSLHQFLSVMSPSDYCHHVMNVLSEEQREVLMCHEIHRKKTYLVNWPHSDIVGLSANNMAKAGFYYVGHDDLVQCAFCRGRLKSWTANDVPMEEHTRLFNFCRFVRALSCGNVEHSAANLRSDDLEHITHYGGSNNTAQGLDANLLGISTARPASSQYVSFSRRRSTFNRWPESSPKSPEALAEAGFYYTGFGDVVRCFFCSGTLKEWNREDEPWRMHARWFPSCLFLRSVKGQQFVTESQCELRDNDRFNVAHGLSGVDTQQRSGATDYMKNFCLELGHDARAIDFVTRRNNGPFTDVKELIEALYKLDDEEVDLDNAELPSVSQRPAMTGNATFEQPSASEPSRSVAYEVYSNSAGITGNCKICEIKAASIVPATRLGLPCGHLIYCDACNEVETRKCLEGGYVSKCPQQNCGAILNGSMRVFFS
ncbi:uncharacterized protein [Watersipora subatra]|uniref:uncharacterized protein n=1 Tax=Watersipora subatra TaxID=2589382 RepID=UPI00355C898A